MRFIVYGVGAIGGTFAAALSLAGYEVAGIARGRMLEAIKAKGLRFRTPEGDNVIALECHASPSEIAFRPDDVILVTTKSQDSVAALQALRAAGVYRQPVICAQNGIDNERQALRFFPNTYGMTVMMPSDYVTPGEVVCYGQPNHGICDVGRYPSGLDDSLPGIAEALRKAHFAVFEFEQVQRSKLGKLLDNLLNVVDAALPRGIDREPFARLARAEAEKVYKAAGFSDWLTLGQSNPRRSELMRMGRVEGANRAGSSSTQSLKRGAGSIETDYLNGEIVLLGRLHGVPTPINEKLAELGQDLVSGKVQAGGLTEAELKRRLGVS